jgi:hypothetical protein
MTYVLNHAGVHFAICQDQEQVDKVLSMSDELTDLQKIVYDEVRGLRDYDHTNLHSIDAIEHAGREVMAAEGDEAWREGIAKGRGEDLAVMLYTSGTTGRPKGVMLSLRQSGDLGAQRQRIRSPRRNRGSSRLSADGLDRRPRVLARPGVHICRLLRQLPGKHGHHRRRPARDRADLFLRAAAGLREPADHRDDPHGGCRPAKRAMFHYFIDAPEAWARPILNGEAVGLLDRLLYIAGRLRWSMGR